MIKRAVLALAFLAVATVAHAAGTIPGFSLTPQFDTFGKVMPGCKLYVRQAGTTDTPQAVYQDTGLTTLLPNPLTCDASGRLPQWFVADGLIKLRLTNSANTQQFVGDNLLVIGPSSGGGGGGGTIDPTTIFTTGDIKPSYGTGTITGWVRANGRTIGSATSGATERANTDTQALFTWLYNSNPNLAVSGGRGANAAADWAANKTIALPDSRGRGIAGLDDMGNSAAGRLTATYFGTVATDLGAVGGTESRTLALSQIPSGITSSGSNAITVYPTGNPASYFPTMTTGSIVNGIGGVGAGSTAATTGGTWVGGNYSQGTNSISVTSNNTGGAAHATVSPLILLTIYIKL